MSESEENNQEEEKITTRLKNTVTNDDIVINTTVKDAKKLKELLEQQNAQNNQIFKENQELKKKIIENPSQAPSGGSTATLNEQQLTGKTVLPLDDNEGLPIDMQTFEDSYDMVNQLEKQANNGSIEAKKALSQLLNKSTEKSWAYEYEGDPKDLFRKLPKNATEKEKQELNEKRKLWSRVKY